MRPQGEAAGLEESKAPDPSLCHPPLILLLVSEIVSPLHPLHFRGTLSSPVWAPTAALGSTSLPLAATNTTRSPWLPASSLWNVILPVVGHRTRCLPLLGPVGTSELLVSIVVLGRAPWRAKENLMPFLDLDENDHTATAYTPGHKSCRPRAPRKAAPSHTAGGPFPASPLLPAGYGYFYPCCLLATAICETSELSKRG